MPSASEYAHAFSSPIDYGSIVANTLEQNRRKELEQAQLAQQAEDRDIKRAQLINETLAPLSKDTGTYYDDIMHQKLADFYTKLYPEFMRQNPNAKLGQQMMFANQYINNVSQNAQQAKQIQAYAKLLASEQGKDIKGINEATLAKELEKSAYDNGDISGDWQDRLAKNINDLDFTGGHYTLNDASRDAMIKHISATQGGGIAGKQYNIGGSVYEDKEGTPYGYTFDAKGNSLVPKTEPTEVSFTWNNGLSPQVSSKVIDLVPVETLNKFAGSNEFAHALHQKALSLQKTDDLAKNMDSETLTRYAGTKLLQDLPIRAKYQDVTQQERDKALDRNWKEIDRASILENRGRQKALEGDRIVNAFNGDPNVLNTFSNTKYQAVEDVNGERKVVDKNGVNLTESAGTGNFTGMMPVGGGKHIQIIYDNGNFYKQEYIDRKGKPFAEGNTTLIDKGDVRNYEKMLLDYSGNKKVSYNYGKEIAPKVAETKDAKPKSTAVDKLVQGSVPTNTPNNIPKDMIREDGTMKGHGFLGDLPNKNGKKSSELSISVGNIEKGKDVLIPTMIPTLTKKELDYLLSNKYNPTKKTGVDEVISQKAIAFARERKAKGLPYFATKEEEGKYSIGNNTKKPKNFTIN